VGCWARQCAAACAAAAVIGKKHADFAERSSAFVVQALLIQRLGTR
jgi:hypothetical protein